MLLTPVVATRVKLIPSVDREIMNPKTGGPPLPIGRPVVPLFIQERLIWLEPATVSTRLMGALGGGGRALVGVVLAMFDGAESPLLAEAAM